MNAAPGTDGGSKHVSDDRTVLGTFWRRKLTILATLVVFVALAWGYIALTPPVYTATASILIDVPDAQAGAGEATAPIRKDAAIAGQLSVIASPNLLREVFDAEGLTDDPEYSGNRLLSSLMTGRLRPPGPPSREAAFERFRRHVSVQRADRSRLVDVTVTSTRPDKAAHIANSIVGRYTSAANEKEASDAAHEAKIDALQAKVRDGERAIAAFKAANGDAGAASIARLKSQIDELSGQFAKARETAGQARNRYRQAREAGETPSGMIKLADLVQSPTADSLRQSYNATASALADAEQVYGPRYPSIRRMKAQLASLEGRMKREARRITARLKAERDRTAEAAKTLKDELAEMRERLTEAERARARLGNLQDSADSARAQLEAARADAQQAREHAEARVPPVQIASRAAEPIAPTWPKPARILPMSALLGLIAGCILALVRGPAGRTAAVEPENPAGIASTPIPAPASPPAAEPRSGVEDQAPAAALVFLGAYDLPAAPGSTARSVIKSIRLAVQDNGRTALSLSVLHLLRRIIARLHQHREPYMLVMSSIADGLDAKLATALVGIGLRSLDEKVLVLEIADRAEAPGPLTSVSSRRGTAIFTDPASHLQTMVVRNGDALGEVVAHYGTDFNFVLVLARPLNDPAYSPALESRADLVIVALTPAEAAVDAGAILASRTETEYRDRMATLVINRVEAGRDGDDTGPRLVASNPAPERPAEGSEG